MVRVIIVEDHRLIREGFKILLQSEKQVKIVGEANNGQELLNLLKENVQAEVIMMDINMPVMGGIEACRLVKKLYPGINILGLSMHESPEYINKMLDSGASGYICKTSNISQIINAIKKTAAGESFLSPDLFQSLVSNSVAFSLPNKSIDRPATEKLSNRELEVLKLIAEGLTNQQIADRLFNSKRTIETHRMNILEKTNCRNTASLIKFAIQNRIIS